MLDELQYLCAEVVEGVAVEDALKYPDRVIVGGRRVTHNKQHVDNPKCRGGTSPRKSTPEAMLTNHFMRPPRI